MKPSDAAIEATSAFLGQDVSAHLEQLGARKALDAFTVPQNDEGLQILAANGDWASVVALADKLEDEAASKSHSFCLKRDKLSEEPDGKVVGVAAASELRIPSKTAAVIARLPYVLVQVTAYFKMQRVGAAKKLLDTLGDLEGEGFLYPGTKENFAPFSLRFLAALMPVFLGVPMDAQRRLYGLLDECVRKRVLSKSTEAALWLHREGRVRRALIFIHYTLGQYAVCIQHFNKLIAATDETNERLSAGKGHGSSLVTGSQRVQRVLVLQQLACLCLHCGALLLSQRAFQQIEEISEEAAGTSREACVMSHIKRMNEAFLLAFYGRFGEAAARFREISASVNSDVKSGANTSESVANEQDDRDALSQKTLFDVVLTQVLANAQTCEAACMPYCQEGSDPHTAIADLITRTESHLKENPQMLASSDAFIAGLVRLYTLAGDRKPKMDLLASVLEVFRCDAASLPNLEKLV